MARKLYKFQLVAEIVAEIVATNSVVVLLAQGRSQYEANRGTCLSHFYSFNTLNTQEENLTMDIASVIIFFQLRPCGLQTFIEENGVKSIEQVSFQIQYLFMHFKSVIQTEREGGHLFYMGTHQTGAFDVKIINTCFIGTLLGY